MSRMELTPAAAEALKGPFSVDYDDGWPDRYGISGQVPGEDDEENTADDERGRHDVRRRAIELLPQTLALLSLAQDLMLDADDRGELDDEDDTSRRGFALLEGAREILGSINAAAAPHEIEPVDAPPEEFRAWLVGRGPYAAAGMLLSPTLNPLALFLEEKHGGEVRVDKGIVDLPNGAGRRRTLPYMDAFLWVLGRTQHNLVGGGAALHSLDEVLAGKHGDGPLSLPL